MDSQQREFGIDLHRNFEDLNGCCGKVMENDLAKELPKKFGVAFDKWSEHGVHYFAAFAVGDFVPHEGCVLLGYSPFEQEDDFLSDQYGLYLTNLVQHYEQCVNNDHSVCPDLHLYQIIDARKLQLLVQ